MESGQRNKAHEQKLFAKSSQDADVRLQITLFIISQTSETVPTEGLFIPFELD